MSDGPHKRNMLADVLLGRYGPHPIDRFNYLGGPPSRATEPVAQPSAPLPFVPNLLSDGPKLPSVVPRSMRTEPIGQSNLLDRILRSVGQPSLDALRRGYEGRATPEEIARTYLETGPMGPFGMVRAMPKLSAEAVSLREAIESVLRRDEYPNYGLRVTEEPLQIGAPPPPSRVWDNGDPTDEFLSGASTVRVAPEERAILYALARAGYDVGDASRFGGHYYGPYVSLIGGRRASRGVDPEELIIDDGTVLGSWIKSFGPGSER